MTLHKVLAAVGAAAVASAGTAAYAATVTQFNFNTSGVPTTVAANVTATSVVNASLNSFSASTNPSSSYLNNVLQAAPGTGGTGYNASSGPASTNLTNTLAQNNLAATSSYFSFTVTPTSGFQMTLTSLTLDGARGAESAPRGVAIYSVVGMGSPVFHGAFNFTTVRPNLANYSFTLTGLTAMTVPVTIRVYVFAPGTANTVEIDNLTLIGSVERVPLVDIPLPAASLAGGGLLAAGLVRRRRF
ncbi:MAG: hypothetical protein ACK4PI_09115 [Tepidisphaerales bacterium]